MAQPRKKRSTKHRGNAAGVVESRGRTGRKLSEQERRPAGAKPTRAERLNRPPTWRSAFNKALIMAAIFVGIIVLFVKQNVSQSIAVGVFLVFMYTPLSYYTDRFMYRRTLARKAGG